VRITTCMGRAESDTPHQYLDLIRFGGSIFGCEDVVRLFEDCYIPMQWILGFVLYENKISTKLCFSLLVLIVK
jgi:hypothetical protein